MLPLSAPIWGRADNPPMTRRAAARLHQGRQLRRRRVRRGRTGWSAPASASSTPAAERRAAQPHRRRRAGGRRPPRRLRAQAAPARVGAAARRLRDRVDLRPAGQPQRLLQPGQARRPCRSSTSRTSTAPCSTRINGDDDTDRLLVALAAASTRGRRRRAPATRRRRGRRVAAGAAVALGVADGAPVPARLDGADRAGRRAPRHRGAARGRPGAARSSWRVAVRETLAALVADGGRIAGFDRAGWYIVDGGDRHEAAPASSCAGSRCRWSRRSGRRSAPRPRATSCCCASSPTTAEGWGECVAMSDPLYSSEYVDAAADVLRRFLVPALAAAGPLDAHAVGARARARSRATGWPRRRWRWRVLDAELRADGPVVRRASSAPSTTGCRAACRSASWTASRRCSTPSAATSTRATSGSS